MDIMIRILKNSVSGGYANDIAQAYEVEDLTGYNGNPVDWVVIVRNTPFITIEEVRTAFINAVRDVSSDPVNPIITVRRCRYYVDWTALPNVKNTCVLQGWADIDWTTAITALMDAATDTKVFP